MARTQIRGQQILDGSIKRKDLNVDDPTHAVIRRVIAGTGVTISSTGVISGTGDVTINATGGGPAPELLGNESSIVFSLQTTDDTETTLGSVEIEDDTTETFLVLLSARGPSDKNYWSQITFSARKNSSEFAEIVGDVVLIEDSEEEPEYEVIIDTDGDDVRIRVIGEDTETVFWQARLFRSSVSGAIDGSENVQNDFNTTLSPSSNVFEIDLTEGTTILGTLDDSVDEWSFINVPSDVGKAYTVTLILEGDSNNTYGSDVSVNSSPVAAGVLWSGGDGPTASDGNDVITFIIVRDASGDIKVFGSYALDFS